jgi:molybdenum cofactor biosynthesis enzyme MoaA
MNLLGGEPLKNKDIIEIIKITRKYYFGYVRIVTNGILIN